MMPLGSPTTDKLLPLSKNEIHLWMTSPKTAQQNHEVYNQGLFERYKTLLSSDEVKKTKRYKFEEDRHSALTTRAFVRDLLSHYAHVAPQDWRFEKGDKDKPEIINAPLALRFNLSHTKDLIICAVMLEDDIGCDVENTTRNNDVLKIADRYFSASETKALFSLPLAQQRSRFFDYWTLKEAYIKAWGLGLAIPLKDFSFSISNKKNSTLCFCEHIENITISFAQHRKDTPEVWRHWLLYPNDKHRIALSVRANKNNQKSEYKFRYFKSTPLVSVEELTTV